MFHILRLILERTLAQRSRSWSETQLEKVSRVLINFFLFLSIEIAIDRFWRTHAVPIEVQNLENWPLRLNSEALIQKWHISLQIVHIIGIGIHESRRAHENDDSSFKFIEKAYSGPRSFLVLLESLQGHSNIQNDGVKDLLAWVCRVCVTIVTISVIKSCNKCNCCLAKIMFVESS